MTCVCGHDEDEHNVHGECEAEETDGPCPCFFFEPELDEMWEADL